jgi:very-short-patch-repair endonuclease
MDDALGRLFALASKHHGLFRLDEARTAGVPDRRVRRLVERGLVERLGQGVHRVRSAPANRDQLLMAAAWRSRGPTSHLSGCELHRLGDQVGRGRPHVAVPHSGAHELQGIVVHRTGDLLQSDVTSVRGIPVTTPTRTLLDVGLLVTPLQLERMVHDALHRGLTTFDRLVAGYYRISRPGRNGASAIGDVLRALDPAAGPTESELESVLLQVLRRHGVEEPVRQHPVTVDGKDFRLDLAYPDVRLFLEGDGFGVHGGRTAFESDRWRQNLLVVDGWWPMRFTWRQLRFDGAGCARQVERKLASLRRAAG